MSCENPLKIETARQHCTADDNDKWANLFGDDDYLDIVDDCLDLDDDESE